jgi:hypothetical protein
MSDNKHSQKGGSCLFANILVHLAELHAVFRGTVPVMCNTRSNPGGVGTESVVREYSRSFLSIKIRPASY